MSLFYVQLLHATRCIAGIPTKPRLKMGAGHFLSEMTAGITLTLSSSVQIGRSMTQSSVTLNFPIKIPPPNEAAVH